MKLMCVRTISVFKRAARHFRAHRHQFRCGLMQNSSLFGAARGQVRGHGVLGAVGGFYLVHGRSVRARAPSVCNNKIGGL